MATGQKLSLLLAAPAALATSCPFTGGNVIEHSLQGIASNKIRFTGITPTVTRRSEAGLSQPKMRILQYSAVPTITVVGDSLDVRLGDCGATTDAPTSQSIGTPVTVVTATSAKTALELAGFTAGSVPPNAPASAGTLTSLTTSSSGTSIIVSMTFQNNLASASDAERETFRRSVATTLGVSADRVRIRAIDGVAQERRARTLGSIEFEVCPTACVSSQSAAGLTSPSKWLGSAVLLGCGATHGGRSGAALVALSLLSAVHGHGDANCDQVMEVEIVTPMDAECAATDPVKTTEAKGSIFDPPTATEMGRVKARMMTYNFATDVGESVTLTAQGGSDGRLPTKNGTAIMALFGNQSIPANSLAIAKATPANLGPIWGGIMTNYIARIDTMAPVKAEALAYIDGTGPKPARYAKVNVNFGGIANPKFIEYKVGPLDETTTSSMTVEKLGTQRWDSRPREGNEMHALKGMVDWILNEPRMIKICQESFGATHGNGLNNHEPAPPGIEAHMRKTQILINYAIAGTWRGKDLHLVPLSFTINNTDRDPSMWTASEFYYNGQGPYTIDALVAAYDAGTLVKVAIPAAYRTQIQTSAFPERTGGTRGTMRAMAGMAGPQQYMPEGPRFEVLGGAGGAGRTIKWMGWEFHAGYTFRAGPAFHDIKFNNERIAYEVSLNEVGLIYSADDPVAGNVFFLDSTFGNGEYRELMAGIDCPAHATYLTNYWWAAPGGMQTASRSMCVYEMWTGAPLWRRGGSFVSGTRNYELHARFAMPNGNYDYVLTFIFKLDGSMRVDCSSTGYIQTHFWNKTGTAADNRDAMAYKVHTYTGGSLHDHTYGFKVDLDILGTANTFTTGEFKMADTLTATNANRAAQGLATVSQKPSYLLFNKMRYFEQTKHATETQMNVNPAQPKEWLFGNDAMKNDWGNVRQYKLVLDQTTSAVVDHDHYTMQHGNGAFSFAKNMLTVTKYSTNEDTLTGPYDLNRLDDPQGGLDGYVNNENILQQDLVAWVTLTAMHLPTSEDYPMVNMIPHGFTLKPYNFFKENAAMDMPHYLRMHPGEAPGDSRQQNETTVPKCTPKKYSMDHGFAGV